MRRILSLVNYFPGSCYAWSNQWYYGGDNPYPDMAFNYQYSCHYLQLFWRFQYSWYGEPV